MASFVRIPIFLSIGMRRFTKAGYERASFKFDSSDDSISLKGKNVIITGANQGIGLATALGLARRGCSLYIVCRNKERGEAALSRIKTESGNVDVHLLLCDISSLSDIKRLVEEYSSLGKPLHILVNNAGLMVKPPAKSVDGYEVNFATNTLGTYAITKLFHPLLKTSAPSKVIFVASGGALTEALEVDDLEGVAIQHKSEAEQSLYARDKRRQLAIVERLATEWAADGVSVYAMHPGWVETEAVRTSMPSFHKTFGSSLRTIEQGADSIIWLAAKPADALMSGEFYCDRYIERKHLPLGFTSHKQDEVDTLMKKLNEMAKL
jgi:dehydrogenase/reductase SDR family protein 12